MVLLIAWTDYLLKIHNKWKVPVSENASSMFRREPQVVSESNCLEQNCISDQRDFPEENYTDYDIFICCLIVKVSKSTKTGGKSFGQRDLMT